MPDIFVLQLPSLTALSEAATPLTHWVNMDTQGVVVGSVGHGSLEEAALAATGKVVRVLVPGTDVLLAAPVFPARSAAKLLQLVPFALEDQLASDVELLHFALGRQRPDQSLPVAVVDHQRLRACLDR
jgi:general secretion pathway protein L